MEKFKGCIVEESLEDNRILNNIKIIKVRITREEEASERWHIYNSILTEEDIEKVHKSLKDGWYMHFWKGNKIIVLFKRRKFIINLKDKESRKEAVNYGQSLGIPKEQLDFEIEF